MNVQEQLGQLLAEQTTSWHSAIPFTREDAVVAVVRELDRRSGSQDASRPDIVAGLHMPTLGGNRALQRCLESTSSDNVSDKSLESWATSLLDSCEQRMSAEIVLSHCETGFMHLAEDRDGTFDAWIATKQLPASWRERDDIDWWATWLARRFSAASAGSFHAMADISLQMMAYQLPYPQNARIGGLPIRIWLDILGLLIARALEAHDCGEAAPWASQAELTNDIAHALDMDASAIGGAIAAFTMNRENAAWHGATPGSAAAPLIGIGGDRLVLSHHGLTTEPLFFLLRELRRRDPEDYHNAAQFREAAFRQDLYACFADKRFVTSENRLRLRRDAGNLRTDIDAAIFDRKTGTLGIFELKSQDPVARSAAALERQRENLLYANRQVGGILDWVKRNGANEIVKRIDPRLTKTFRAHKIYPFVLGRYLVPAGNGAQPDPRAAWGTWPGLLRLLDERPIGTRDTNPIASLHARLANAPGPVHPQAPGREVHTGEIRIRVHPSWASLQVKSE